MCIKKVKNIIITILLFVITTNYYTESSESKFSKPILREQYFLKKRGKNLVELRNSRLKALNEQQSHFTKTKKLYETLQSEIPVWKNIGPNNIGGRVRSIVVHPEDENIVYIGAASGGIWKTSNGGNTWTPIFDFQNAVSFGALAIDFNNPNTIYAATGEMIIGGGSAYLGNGIYKSQDGGNTWRHLGMSHLVAFSKIIVHPKNSKLLYAGTVLSNGGVYRSTDAGESWEKLYDGNITDLSINYNDENELIAAVNNYGMIHSSDQGKTWSTRNSGIDNISGRVSVQAYEKDFNIMYLLTEAANHGSAIYRSSDRGNTWDLVHNSGTSFFNYQGYYNNFVRIHPSKPGFVLAGGIDLWISTNSGNLWNNASDRATNSRIHVDQHHAAFAPSNHNTIYLANDGGIYKTKDAGKTWFPVNNGLAITQFYAMSLDIKQKNRNFGGTQDHGTLGNPSENWRMLVGGDGFDSFVHPNDPDIIFGEIYYGSIFKYNLRNDSYQFLVNGMPEDDNGEWHSPFVFDYNNHIMYIGKHQIYASYDYGDYFFPISTMYKHPFTAICPSETNAKVIFAGNIIGQLIYTENGGTIWENINNDILPGAYVTCITSSSQDTGTFYVSFSGYGSSHIFKTIDMGANWSAIDKGMPDVPVNSILLHPDNESIIFAATDIGVYATFNGGIDWIPYGEGLPRAPVSDLRFQNNRILLPELTLRAASYGRSIWEIEIHENEFIEPVIINPSGGETFIGSSSREVAWNGFEHPVRVELSHNSNEDFYTIRDSVYSNTSIINIPDINSHDARIRVSSINSNVQRISRTFSIRKKFPGAILSQSSLGFNTYGIKIIPDGKMWVVDFFNSILNLYEIPNFKLIKKLELPVKGLYTDLDISNTLDTIFINKMSDEFGTEPEIIIIDTNGSLLSRINIQASYPVGLSYINYKLYVSERDDKCNIYIINPNDPFGKIEEFSNPVNKVLAPRCISYNNGLLHQTSTYFTSNTLTNSEISVFSPDIGSPIIETIPLVSRTGNINARGIDVDFVDSCYYVSEYNGTIYKIAYGNNTSDISNDTLSVKLSIYPNPVIDYLRLELPEFIYDLNYEYSITNSIGQIIDSGRLNSINYIINTRIHPPGIYCFIISQYGKVIAIENFIKMK